MPSFLTIAATSILLIAFFIRLGVSYVQHGATEFQVRNWTVGRGGKTPLRIGHVSDLHHDPKKGTLPQEVVQKAIAELRTRQLDVILATGDYVNDDPSPSKELAEKYLSPLRFSTPHGVLASMGNHEYKRRNGREVVTRNLSSAGVRVLINDSVRIQDAVVVGLDDVTGVDWSGAKGAVEAGLDTATENGLEKVVVMSHNPSTAKQIVQWVENRLAATKPSTPPHVLILSGHTHGGQICTPSGIPILSYLRRVFDALRIGYRRIRLTPFRLAFTVRHWVHAEGLHRLTPDITLVVSRGLGSHLGARLNCPTDIGVIDF